MVVDRWCSAQPVLGVFPMKKTFLTGIAALSLLYATGAHATDPLKWQCGNTRVTVTYKLSDDDNLFSGTTEYAVTGIEKANNRFKWASDGLYLNDKICWPVQPITCLKPDGTSESCEKRQVPLPKSRPEDAPEPVFNHTTVLYYEPGGVFQEHMKRWEELALSGDYVEIRGACASGCTLIMMHVPSNRLCFGEYASLQFHAAGRLNTPFPPLRDKELTKWMVDNYPREIRTWLKDLGAPESLTLEKVLILNSAVLWNMGYRKCEPEKLVPMTILRSKRAT